MAEITAKSAGSLTIQTTAIVTAVWTGVMGFAFAASYLMPGQLFILLALALAIGAGLTALAFWFTLRLAEVVLKDDDGNVVVVNGLTK